MRISDWSSDVCSSDLMRPMLATRGDHVPAGGAWSHEVKWDGMRILAEITGTGARLTSRNENDVSVSFPELHDLARVGSDLLLDGEVVAFEQGIPSFGALADRMHVRDARKAARLVEKRPVTFLVFDVMRRDGHDLSRLPLSARREVLADLDLVDVHWQVPPAYAAGEWLLEIGRTVCGERGV